MKKSWIIPIIACCMACHAGQHAGEVLPSFEVLLPDSTTHFQSDKISGGKPIALLYFSPDCEHCQEETKNIVEHMDSLKDVRFFFVTNEPFDGMKNFSQYFGLNQYPNVTIGRDEQFFMIRHFKGIFPPYMIVYDRHRRQKTVFSGTKTATELINCFNSL